MKKIVCIALVAMLLAVSTGVFAEGSQKYYRVALENPTLAIASGDEAKELSLESLSISYERGISGDDMCYVFDVSANDVSAIRAVLMQNSERLLAGINGIGKALSLPIGSMGKGDMAKNIDLTSLLKFIDDFSFVDEGETTCEFMYGANLLANKTSVTIDSAQLDAIIDSFSAMSEFAGADLSGLKELDKSIVINVWVTDDIENLRVDCTLSASYCEQSVVIPIVVLGKLNSNGTIDVQATMTESESSVNFNAHITPDEQHPLHPSVNIDCGIFAQDEEVISGSFVSSCGHTEEASIHAVSMDVKAMGESVFKLMASERKTDSLKTYTFKAGLNDELKAYCSTEPYENEEGKGEKGTIEIDVNTNGEAFKLSSDISMGARLGTIDASNLTDLDVITPDGDITGVQEELKNDLFKVAIRAVGVLSNIPAVQDVLFAE